MWWEFHRLMDLTPEQLVDEDEPIGLLEPVEPLVETEAVASRPGATASRTRTIDLGRGDVYDPSEAGRPGRQARSTWAIGERRRGRPGRARRSTSSARPERPHPTALVPLEPVPDRRAPGAAVRARRVGRRPRHRRRRAAPRGPRPAARATARGSGRRTASAARPGRRDRPRRCASPRPRARPDRRSPSRDRRARARPTRGPDDLRPARRGQAGRHHGHEPQGHRQPPQGGPQGGGRGRHRRHRAVQRNRRRDAHR